MQAQADRSVAALPPATSTSRSMSLKTVSASAQAPARPLDACKHVTRNARRRKPACTSHTCTRTHTRASIHTHIRVHKHRHPHIHAHAGACAHAHTRTSRYIDAHARTHAQAPPRFRFRFRCAALHSALWRTLWLRRTDRCFASASPTPRRTGSPTRSLAPAPAGPDLPSHTYAGLAAQL